MDYKDIVKQMIEFNKTAFDNNYRAMNELQKKTEEIINKFSEALPEEGNKAFAEWVKVYKKGSEDFKKSADEAFSKGETLFGGTGGTGPRKK